MKNGKWLLLILISGFAQAFEINNTSLNTFVGNQDLNLTVKGGQRARFDGYLVNGGVYGYLNRENMNDNQCYFEAGTDKIDWNTVSIPIQFSTRNGCTVNVPRLCCIKMPDEF